MVDKVEKAVDQVQTEVKVMTKKIENLADKGLIKWAAKPYSWAIMLGVVVVLPLIGVVVGYNLK